MPKIYSTSYIKKKVQEYGKIIDAPQDLLIVRTTPAGFGYSHIEIDEQGYQYIITERGHELERLQTDNLDELLYWICKDITFDMATRYELENRVPTEDFRRIYFAKNIELMERINTKYAKWLKKELDEVLEKYPYES